MGRFDRFITWRRGHAAWFHVLTRAASAAWRLSAVLVLSLVALLVVLVGAPGSVGVLLVGAFMLVAPGLLLVELVRLDDGLLSTVLAMMAGPVLWVLLPTVELFVGAWRPEATVAVVAVVLAGVSAVLVARRHRAPAGPPAVPRLRMPERSPQPEAEPEAEPPMRRRTDVGPWR